MYRLIIKIHNFYLEGLSYNIYTSRRRSVNYRTFESPTERVACWVVGFAFRSYIIKYISPRLMRYIGRLYSRASAAEKLDCFRSLYGFFGVSRNFLFLLFYRAFTANPILTNVSKKKKKNVQGCPVK